MSDYKDKAFKLWVECDYKERYWKLKRKKEGKLDVGVAIVGSLACLASIVSLFQGESAILIKVCGYLSAGFGIFALVIAPVFGFNTRFFRAKTAHQTWINLERKANALQFDVENLSPTTARKRIREIQDLHDNLYEVDTGFEIDSKIEAQALIEQDGYLKKLGCEI